LCLPFVIGGAFVIPPIEEDFMSRYLLVPLVALVVAVPAGAKRAPAPPPIARAIRADAVFVGKVTAIEKDTVDLAQYAGDPTKVAHKLAVVKVETPIGGVTGTTHVKVAFVPPPPPGSRPVRSGAPASVPTEGQEALFFLVKHPGGDYYAMSWAFAPVDAKDATFKAEVESAKKVVAVLADPTKGLKSEKQGERFFAATALVAKYRHHPENAEETETVKVSAEESQLILKALAEQKDWAAQAEVGSATQTMFMLGLTEEDGFKTPTARPQPGVNPNDQFRDLFVKWLDGPGKTYQISRLVAKKK
jgi:hypothetical protein